MSVETMLKSPSQDTEETLISLLIASSWLRILYISRRDSNYSLLLTLFSLRRSGFKYALSSNPNVAAMDSCNLTSVLE